jgi:hypothetical protein
VPEAGNQTSCSLHFAVKLLTLLSPGQQVRDACHGDKAHVLNLLNVKFIVGIEDHGAEEKVVDVVNPDPQALHHMQFACLDRPHLQFVQGLQGSAPLF